MSVKPLVLTDDFIKRGIKKMTKQPKKRTYVRGEYEVFRNYQLELDMPAKALAEALGYTDGTIHSWSKDNPPPKVAVVAMEGLVRRRAQTKDENFILVLHMTPAKWRGLEPVLNAMGLTGHRFPEAK